MLVDAGRWLLLWSTFLSWVPSLICSSRADLPPVGKGADSPPPSNSGGGGGPGGGGGGGGGGGAPPVAGGGGGGGGG